MLLFTTSVRYSKTLFQPSRIISPSPVFNGGQKTSYGGRRCGPAFALLFHPLLANSSPKSFFSSDAIPQSEAFIISPPFIYRSRSVSTTPREYSHRNSLMARDVSWTVRCAISGGVVVGARRFLLMGDGSMALRQASKAAARFTDEGDNKSQNPNCKCGLLFEDGPLFSWPNKISTSAQFWFFGSNLINFWPRSVFFILLANPILFKSSNFAEKNGRGLHSCIVMTLIDRVVQIHLIILVEDIFNVVNRGNPSKKPVIQPSSLIERTFAWSPTTLLQNHLWTLTIFLEAVCTNPRISMVKAFLSTSLCLYWNVTNHQSPKIFVELSSTHQSLACGKLRSSSCLRYLDLPSNYRMF